MPNLGTRVSTGEAQALAEKSINSVMLKTSKLSVPSRSLLRHPETSNVPASLLEGLQNMNHLGGISHQQLLA
ncbi:MAG: hypothetical protein WCC37_22725, partial [Candidatus Sulfotelmatobacter sp.]